jgi:hypothetical protein
LDVEVRGPGNVSDSRQSEDRDNWRPVPSVATEAPLHVAVDCACTAYDRGHDQSGTWALPNTYYKEPSTLLAQNRMTINQVRPAEEIADNT